MSTTGTGVRNEAEGTCQAILRAFDFIWNEMRSSQKFLSRAVMFLSYIDFLCDTCVWGTLCQVLCQVPGFVADFLFCQLGYFQIIY